SLLGQPMAGHNPEEIARAGIGRSFQITNLFPALSVGENIRLAAQARHPRRFDPLTNALAIEAINAETDATIRYLGLAGIEKAEAGTLYYGGPRLLDMGVALATAPAPPRWPPVPARPQPRSMHCLRSNTSIRFTARATSSTM